MERVVVTGANRGIGLEIVRQYLQKEDTQVFATCRKPDEATDLNRLARQCGDRLTVLRLDAIDESSIKAVAATVAEKVTGIDLLFNNAAINPPGEYQTLEKLNSEGLLFMLHTNTVGPFIIAQSFANLLKAGLNARVVNLSSSMGSIQLKSSGGFYGYSTSKAALNMVTRGLAADLGRHNVITVSLDPGWVQTDMGGSSASLTPQQSVSSIIKVVSTLSRSDNGRFMGWDSESRPW